MEAGDREAARLTTALCVIGLAGMAYCHGRDVGMKFDEHVYYMATLFCCNIALSIALIPALLLRHRLGAGARRRLWQAALALALATIAGFLYSRTLGFPEMADHVGEWDALGLTSVAFEVVVALTAGWWLLHTRAGAAHQRTGGRFVASRS